jgi:alpha-N-acetylglucosamine transferase
VFAGGISYKFQNEIKYIELYADTSKNLIGDNLVRELIDKLFEEHKIKGYTFYSHNLSRFDGLFLVSALSGSTKYKLKGIWKENSLIKLVVINRETNDRIIFIDSLKIVNSNLDKALKAYGCTFNKGILPYLFYNHDTLNYIGKIPEFKYYSNISIEDYNKLIDQFDSNNNLFDAKIECLQYLKKDVLGLLELMIKLSNYFDEEFNYNLTDKCTIPGIA